MGQVIFVFGSEERKQSGGEKVSQLRKCSSSFLISNILENESSDTQPSAGELPPMSRRTGAQSRVRTSGRRRKVGQETLGQMSDWWAGGQAEKWAHEGIRWVPDIYCRQKNLQRSRLIKSPLPQFTSQGKKSQMNQLWLVRVGVHSRGKGIPVCPNVRCVHLSRCPATWESPGVDEGRQFDKWKGQWVREGHTFAPPLALCSTPPTFIKWLSLQLDSECITEPSLLWLKQKG